MKYAPLVMLFVLFTVGCNSAPSLINQDLDNWQNISFGGEGEVYYRDGALNLDMGNTLTGVKYTGDIAELFGPDMENYEIALQAKRVEGQDIFMGLTFPVGSEGHVSLVLGGWAGAVTGISCLDGLNAAENSTTKFRRFEDNQWYDVRIRLTTEKIECWIDDEKIVDELRADYNEFAVHGAVSDTVPFSLFTYGTWGAFRDLRVQRLD